MERPAANTGVFEVLCLTRFERESICMPMFSFRECGFSFSHLFFSSFLDPIEERAFTLDQMSQKNF